MYAVSTYFQINLFGHFDTARHVETVCNRRFRPSYLCSKTKLFALPVALEVIFYDGEVSAKFVG
jgi:hypothetical protein